MIPSKALKLERWLFTPAPAERLAALRILFGLYGVIWSVARLPAHLGHADQVATRWEPIGFLAPFGDPLPSPVVVALAIGTPLLGLAYAAGWRFWASGPAFAVALLALTTLDSSWGMIFHTENLMVLHVVIVALAPGAAHSLSIDWRRRTRSQTTGAVISIPAHGRYGWPIRLATVVIVLAYMLAGIAKLRGAGVGWGSGEILRNLVAHDNLRKALLGDTYSPVGNLLVAHTPWVFTPLAVATLAVELGAGVLLLGQRWRTAWAATAWLFHLGVVASMAILFPYQLSGVAFAPLFRVERLKPMRWLAMRLAGSTQRPSTAAARVDLRFSPSG